MEKLFILEKDLVNLEKMMRKARARFVYKNIKKRQLRLLMALSKDPLSKKALIKVLKVKRKRAKKIIAKALDAGLIQINNVNNRPVIELTKKGNQVLATQIKVISTRRKELAKKVTSCLTAEEKLQLCAMAKKILVIAKIKKLGNYNNLKRISVELAQLPEDQRIILALKYGAFIMRKESIESMLVNHKVNLILFTILQKGPMTFKKLCKITGIKRAKLCKALKRAKNAGLITICNCGKCKRIVLTTKGRKKIIKHVIKISNIRAVRRAMILREIKEGLTEEEFATFILCLAKVKKNLNSLK